MESKGQAANQRTEYGHATFLLVPPQDQEGESENRRRLSWQPTSLIKSLSIDIARALIDT